MPAYFIFNQDILDPEKYGEYHPGVRATLNKYGAKPLVVTTEASIIEGDPRSMTVVLEFDNKEAAQTWYNSPEYQAIIGLRHESTAGWAILAEGLAPPPG